MDPLIAQLLVAGFAIGSVIAAYEMKSAFEPPACPECVHCQARALAKQRHQEELSEAYARRVGLLDPDDEERRKRPRD